VRAVAGVGRYAACVMACATALFCVGNVSGQTPQPYEASLFAAARCAFGFFGASSKGASATKRASRLTDANEALETRR